MLKQRKVKETPADTPEAQQPKTAGVKSRNSCSSILISLLVGLVILSAVSFMVTDSFTFGIPLPTFRRVKRVFVRNCCLDNQDGPEITLTQEELSKYDGSDPSLPLYIAIKYVLSI